MKLLAISGSARLESINTALLRGLRNYAADDIELLIFHRLDTLPVFSPDLEGERTPTEVLEFLNLVSSADGIIISSPEYVRAIPGGLKNAIDWMVSRFEVVGKPIALAHASHRGDDMLTSLRLVLSTVSDKFLPDVFLRIPLIGKTASEASATLRSSEFEPQIREFLSAFMSVVRAQQVSASGLH